MRSFEQSSNHQQQTRQQQASGLDSARRGTACLLLALELARSTEMIK